MQNNYFPENTAPRSHRKIWAPIVPPVLPPTDFPIDRPSSAASVFHTFFAILPPTESINVGTLFCVVCIFSLILAESISSALSRSIGVLYFCKRDETERSHPSSASESVSIRDSGGAIIVRAKGVGIHFSFNTVTNASPIPRDRSSSSIE